MGRPQRSWLLRLLRRLLVRGRGEVRALEDAIHIAGVLRLVALLAATIVLPALLLAYFGLSGIRAEQAELLASVQRDAQALANAFWASTDSQFTGFENRVRNRLEAGRSPLDNRGELHPQLLVALRFAPDGSLLGPFAVPESRPDTVEDLFEPNLARAMAAEREGHDPAAVARLYGIAARSASTRALQARARFDRARMLLAAGREREATVILDQISRDQAEVRDPWGFRLGDLARLTAAMRQLERDPEAGAASMKALIEELVGARWTLGAGGEAAVARKALSLLEPYGEREWAATMRGRLAERAAMLYQAERLLPEFRAVVGITPGLRVDPGTFRWRTGDRAIWATTWWGDDLYAFGLDRAAVVDGLKAAASGGVLPDAPIHAYLVGPDDRSAGDALVEKSLSPWLSGWSLVVEPRDPAALLAQQRRKRDQRIAIIVLSLVMIGVGIAFSAVLLTRELEVARMKADFASNVSHELRSPITQIRLKGESLLFGLAETPEELEHHYRAIIRESERLSRLVDNVLDFGAIERGAKSYTLRPGDLAETVRRAVDSIRSSQEVRDKVLDIDLPADLPVVHHDADAVAQCVINLVSNAAKYSEAGAAIRIHGKAVDDRVDISVTDAGIGIAPHDLQHIFEPFYRSRGGDARRRKGTGIGLTITRYIMQAHGGTIHVRSRLGRGSTFTLRFPLEPPPDAVKGRPLGRDGRIDTQGA